MTSPDSPSPRTEAGKPFTFERWLAAVHEDHNGLIWTTKDELRAVFEHEFHAEAAQEAPAPEGLRDAVADIASRIEGFENRGYVSLDIGVVASWRGTLRAALSAPPSPAEPPDAAPHNRWASPSSEFDRAEDVLAGMLALQRLRGRLSKVTVSDVRTLLAAIPQAAPPSPAEPPRPDDEPMERCCTLVGCKCRYAPSRRGSNHDHAKVGCKVRSEEGSRTR